MPKNESWFHKHPVLAIAGGLIALVIILYFLTNFFGEKNNNPKQDLNNKYPSSTETNSENQIIKKSGVGYSRDNPAPIDKTLIAEYQQAGKPKVKAEITLLQVIRGAEALNRIKKENYLNSNPDEGQEYILLKIRFKLLELSEGQSDSLSRYFFTIVSGDGLTYDSDIGDFGATADPEPRLDREIFVGATYDGWVSYEVDVDDTKPLLWFEPAGLSKDSDTLWFKL